MIGIKIRHDMSADYRIELYSCVVFFLSLRDRVSIKWVLLYDRQQQYLTRERAHFAKKKNFSLLLYKPIFRV